MVAGICLVYFLTFFLSVLLVKGTPPPSAAYRNAYTVLQREAPTDAWSPGTCATTHRATPPDPTTGIPGSTDSTSVEPLFLADARFPVPLSDGGPVRSRASPDLSWPCPTSLSGRWSCNIFKNHAISKRDRYRTGSCSLLSDLPTHRVHISNTIQKYGK